MIRFLKSNSSYVMKPELAGTTAKATILVGGKEQKTMLRSAEILHVDRTRGVIEDEDSRMLDQRAGDAEALLLSTRDVHPSLT